MRDGAHELEWAEIRSTANGHEALVRVMADALKIDGVRVNVSAHTAQVIADEIGGVLLTPKLSDLIFAQAARVLRPKPRRISSSTAAMVAHSRAIDAELGDRVDGLVATVGKDWVLTNQTWQLVDRVANYGWHFRGSKYQGLRGEPSVSAKGVRVIQGVGTRHDARYVDYSQVCRLASEVCLVDGVEHDLRAVMMDAELAPLVSHEGPLRVTRIPGVPSPAEQEPPSQPVRKRPTLRRGSRGKVVERWQVVVGAIADGRFGPSTEVATRAWQRAHGLLADGVVGPATWAVWEATSSGSGSAPRVPSVRVLRRGSRGDDVARWQRFLRGAVADDLVVDGRFGPATVAATERFQQANGLEVDGVVGNRTLGVAMSQGFEVVVDAEDESEAGPSWPLPPTDLKPLSLAGRRRLFGKFRFVPAPTAGNPEGIRILDNWRAENVLRVTIPQLAGVRGAHARGNAWFHRKVAAQVVALFAAWESAGLAGAVLTWAGSFNPRFVRGSRTYLSNHAWGTAFDINAQWNPFGAQPALAGSRGSVRHLVEIANRHGFFWGGHFPRRPDGMHFEAAAALTKAQLRAIPSR